VRRALATLGSALLVSLAGAACGGSSSPAPVKVVITAPTDGATVAVSSIYALGTVEPAGAVVDLSGRRLHVAHGTFRQRVLLHRGLNRLTLVARAPGHLPPIVKLAGGSERTAGHGSGRTAWTFP
jgi:hypothetical protein